MATTRQKVPLTAHGFEAFETRRITVDGVTLFLRTGGAGPPLILLHGFPQTHRAWHRVAAELSLHFQVVIPDLRGYGQSGAPADDAGHTVYSKRAMARDVTGLMDALGLRRAHVLGHDRGGRVAYRMALDHPRRIGKLGIIEIVPTRDFWAAWNADIALAAYHWTFLAQPAPLPESLIGKDPVGFLDATLTAWTEAKSLDVFAPDALRSYRDQMSDPARVAAMCADYRAGASTDRRLDQADRTAGRMIAAPLRFLWAEGGFPARTGDPAGIWRRWAADVSHASCRSGHFVMEENPRAVLDCFLPFFREP